MNKYFRVFFDADGQGGGRFLVRLDAGGAGAKYRQGAVLRTSQKH